MAYQPPTAEQALEFAAWLDSGATPADAVRLVDAVVMPEAAADLAVKWERDAAVRAAQVTLRHGEWRSLTSTQRAEIALERHHSQLAYVLRTSQYAEASPGVRAMLDNIREALEKYLASRSGKSSPLADVWTKALATATATKGPTPFKALLKNPEKVQ